MRNNDVDGDRHKASDTCKSKCGIQANVNGLHLCVRGETACTLIAIKMPSTHKLLSVWRTRQHVARMRIHWLPSTDQTIDEAAKQMHWLLCYFRYFCFFSPSSFSYCFRTQLLIAQIWCNCFTFSKTKIIEFVTFRMRGQSWAYIRMPALLATYNVYTCSHTVDNCTAYAHSFFVCFVFFVFFFRVIVCRLAAFWRTNILLSRWFCTILRVWKCVDDRRGVRHRFKWISHAKLLKIFFFSFVETKLNYALRFIFVCF